MLHSPLPPDLTQAFMDMRAERQRVPEQAVSTEIPEGAAALAGLESALGLGEDVVKTPRQWPRVVQAVVNFDRKIRHSATHIEKADLSMPMPRIDDDEIAADLTRREKQVAQTMNETGKMTPEQWAAIEPTDNIQD